MGLSNNINIEKDASESENYSDIQNKYAAIINSTETILAIWNKILEKWGDDNKYVGDVNNENTVESAKIDAVVYVAEAAGMGENMDELITAVKNNEPITLFDSKGKNKDNEKEDNEKVEEAVNEALTRAGDGRESTDINYPPATKAGVKKLLKQTLLEYLN